MKTDIKTVKGKKGGGDAPYEAPNSLQANTVARIVDLLCEGPIEGPANGYSSDPVDVKWVKSTYYNEIPVMQNIGPGVGPLNFEGTTIAGVLGEPYATQNPIPGFDKVENIINVGAELSFGTPALQSISDDTIDDIKITLQVNGLLVQEDDGDMRPTSVSYRITIQPDGGAESDVASGTISGKTTSRYQRSVTIQNLSSYGEAPWTVRVYRITPDSTSSKLINGLSWLNYISVKHVKLAYPDSVVVGHILDAKVFNNQVPNRCFKIKGLQIKYPSNYDPENRTYTGDWAGTFSTGYCNNPAWVVYDLLTNSRYGMGLSESQVDKWALYSVANYCDGQVNVVSKIRSLDLNGNWDGTYTDSSSTEPRFTFNGVIPTREQALAVVTHLCSVFRGFPIWSSGFVSFVQDAPKAVSRIASPANVLDGVFEYAGTPKQLRHTAIKVSYNNPENFSKLDVVVVEDEDAIQEYGYNPMDIVAFGCDSRSEATRRGKYILYTDIEQTESVSFRGGYEWADCIPGEVVAVQDPNYGQSYLSGRIISATATSITVESTDRDNDKKINIEAGVTYTLYVQSARDSEGDETAGEPIFTTTLNNSAGVTDTLTWAVPYGYTIKTDAGFVISSNTVQSVRTFQVTRIAESELTEFEVSGIEYNANKYAEVEDGLVIQPPPILRIPSGELTPPSSMLVQPYTYSSGDSSNRKYGLLISWIPSDDARTSYYNLEMKQDGRPYENLKYTSDSQFDWKDVPAGEYDFRVQARNATAKSTFAYYNNFTLGAYLGGPLPPTNLDTKDGGGTFNGPDCEIEWDPSEGSGWTPDDNTGVLNLDSTSVGDSNIVGYKVEVYKVDDTLLRTFTTASKYDTEYIYTLEMNKEDNSGVPIRQIKFKVYTQDVYGDNSVAATLVASNPQPDMSSSTPTVDAKPAYLKVTWTKVNDNDMDHYDIYCDENNPPTTVIGTKKHPSEIVEVFGLLYGTTYYVKVVPYDGFGVGTASQIETGSPTQIPDINIDIELTGSIDITTDSTSYVGSLNALYDGSLDSTGVTFTSPEDNYVQYRYRITNYFDRMAVWVADSITSVYFGLSYDTGETWEYFAGLYQDSEGYNHLVSYGENQANAKTNAWDLSAGFNTAKIPNNKIAYRVRMFFASSTDTEIFEFIPSRIIISELAAIQNLAAVTADLGTVIAGNVQSSDYSATEGFSIDLDAKKIYMGGSDNPIFEYDSDTHSLNCTGVFVFKSGTTGWYDIDDRPAWEHPEDITLINGGMLYVGSNIKLNEGGSAEFGNGNVIIDTAGSHGSIVVAVDGGPTAGDYCQLSDGDISFFMKVGGTHHPYKSLKRVEKGIAKNGVWTYIPGYFKNQPEIMISPASMAVYDARYSNQTQKIVVEATNIHQYNTYQWCFLPKATLELATGSVTGILVNDTESRSTYWAGGVVPYSWYYDQSPYIYPVANTTQISVVVRSKQYGYQSGANAEYVTPSKGGSYTVPAYSYFYTTNYMIRLYVYDTTYGTRYTDVHLEQPVNSGYVTYFPYHVSNVSQPPPAPESVRTLAIAGGNIAYFFVRLYWKSNNGYYKVVGVNYPTSYNSTFTVESYSSNLAATSVPLQMGTLNYLAIGS